VNAMVWDWVMGDGSCGSRVSSMIGQVGHGSQNVTHCQLCCEGAFWLVKIIDWKQGGCVSLGREIGRAGGGAVCPVPN